MNPIYYALVPLSVTIHISSKMPEPKHPQAYGTAICSGVFISPNEVLTAAHCVEQSRGRQWIKTSDGQSFSVSIVKTDKYKDLALLKVDSKIKHKYVSIGKPVQITDAIYTVNSGEDLEKSFNTGLVSNLILDPDYKTLSILHTAVIMPGASGSGLFNRRGKLIGINVAIIHNMSEATDILEVKAFLNDRN